jgi:hypothetical protein
MGATEIMGWREKKLLLFFKKKKKKPTDWATPNGLD